MANKNSKPKRDSANNRSALTTPPKGAASNGERSAQRSYSIPDYRLECLEWAVRQVATDDGVRYEIGRGLSAPVPPLRESRYLSREQCLEIYRWMQHTCKMEQTMENLYTQRQ